MSDKELAKVIADNKKEIEDARNIERLGIALLTLLVALPIAAAVIGMGAA